MQRLLLAKIAFAGTALRSYARLRGNSREGPAALAAGALARAKFWCSYVSVLVAATHACGEVARDDALISLRGNSRGKSIVSLQHASLQG